MNTATRIRKAQISALETQLAHLKALDGKSFIGIVLDRSGSMGKIRSDMEGALNEFVKDQQALPGECEFTLVQFDSSIETVYRAAPINTVGPLFLQPRGMTSLLDAMGTALTEARQHVRLSEIPPEHKIMAVITDGMENASHSWTRSSVFELVTEMRREGWEFTFIGANQDAIREGGNLGIPMDSSLTYTASAQGVSGSVGAFTHNTTLLRSGAAQAFSYNDEDRTNSSAA